MSTKGKFVEHITVLIAKELMAKLPEEELEVKLLLQSQSIIDSTITHIVGGIVNAQEEQ